MSTHVDTQKALEFQLQGFSIPFWRGGLFPQAGYRYWSPSSHIVGNYTCRNGDKKRCKNIHANTPPFSTGLGRGSMAMIT